MFGYGGWRPALPAVTLPLAVGWLSRCPPLRESARGMHRGGHLTAEDSADDTLLLV
jgi:hypothetical protein